MNLAALVKEKREQKGWTQKQLAEAIGVTASFITKLEAGETFPSYERCIALSGALALSADVLWSAAERERAEIAQQRIRTRGAAVRGALYARSAITPPESQMSVEEIARTIEADSDLQTAHQNLMTALADPQMRPTVLAALEAFARAARPTEKET